MRSRAQTDWRSSWRDRAAREPPELALVARRADGSGISRPLFGVLDAPGTDHAGEQANTAAAQTPLRRLYLAVARRQYGPTSGRPGDRIAWRWGSDHAALSVNDGLSRRDACPARGGRSRRSGRWKRRPNSQTVCYIYRSSIALRVRPGRPRIPWLKRVIDDPAVAGDAGQCNRAQALVETFRVDVAQRHVPLDASVGLAT